MKKILLITLVGTIFAVASANACDTCAKHTHKADGTHEACAADCDKKCCAESKAACKEGCDKKCCAEKKAACKEGCTKPCCAKKADTAAKPEGAAPCCEAILGKAA